MLTITASTALCVGTLPLVPHFGRTAYAVWGFVLYFLVAGNYTVMPAVVKKTFGDTHAASNVGVLFTSLVTVSPFLKRA